MIALLLLASALAVQVPDAAVDPIRVSIRSRQYGQAEAQARKLIASDPTACAAHMYLGIALDAQGRTAESMQAFHAAPPACQAYTPALEAEAQIAYTRRLPEARAKLENVLQVSPNNVVAHAMLATTLARSGDCAGALPHFTAAEALTVKTPAAATLSADCLLQLHEAEAARRLLQSALAIHEDKELSKRLAEAALQQNDGAAAEAALLPVLQAAPDDVPAMLLQAKALELQNKTPSAVEVLRRAIGANPRNTDSYIAFAQLCFDHGSFDVGIDLVDRGLRVLPDQPRLLIARGVLKAQLGQLDAALQDFEAAHRLAPQLAFSEDAMGVLLSQRHQDKAALAFFAERLKKHPEDAMLHYFYAEQVSHDANLTEASMREAVASLREGIRLDPSYVPAYGLLCTLQRRMGDEEGVLATAKAALARDPEDESVLYQAMLASRSLNHTADVESYLTQLKRAKEHHGTLVTRYVLQEKPTP